VEKGETFPVSWSAYLTLLQAVKHWPDVHASIQDSQCGRFSCISTHFYSATKYAYEYFIA